MTNVDAKRKGGYEGLLVYHLAIPIFDLTHQFCHQYLVRREHHRTVEQMTQAARSGKQNIVEASKEKSQMSNIKLTGVSRGSFEELLKDFEDFLRLRKLPIWDKADPRLKPIRDLRINLATTHGNDWANWTHWSNWTNSPEPFANLMITLISRENYLLDRLIESQERKFVSEGGYREQMFVRRIQFRKTKLD